MSPLFLSLGKKGLWILDFRVSSSVIFNNNFYIIKLVDINIKTMDNHPKS